MKSKTYLWITLLSVLNVTVILPTAHHNAANAQQGGSGTVIGYSDGAEADGVPAPELESNPIPLPPDLPTLTFTGGGGSYMGPSDTVPPGISCFPGMGHPTLCPSTPCRVTPCGAMGGGCFCEHYVYTKKFAGVSWNSAPFCVWDDPNQAKPVWVAEIKISDLQKACSAWMVPDAQICVAPIPTGVCMVHTKLTTAFSYFRTGVPLGGGSFLPICGMEFTFNGIKAVNGYYNTYPCTAYPPFPMQIMFDCACFNKIIAQYAIMGGYTSIPNTPGKLHPNSVVMTVIIKGCTDGTCDCPPPVPDHWEP